MKKIQVLFFSLLFLVLFQAPLFAEEMRVGYNHLSNVIEKNEDATKPVGRMVDYWEKIAEKMGVSIQWVGPLPVTRLVLYLKNNQIDAIYVASRNKNRETFAIYPQKPIFIKRPVVCFRKEMNIHKLTSWTDLEALPKIGVIPGYALTVKLKKEYPLLHLATIKDKDPVNFSLSSLFHGDLDAFIYPGRTGLAESITELGFEGHIKIVDAPVPAKPYYAIFAMQRMDLVEKYNKYHDEVSF